MGAKHIPLAGFSFNTEVSTAVFKTSVTSITISGGVATVVATAHGLAVGAYVTFSGSTGVTGLNSTTWRVATVTDANTYTFLTSLTGAVAGTIIQEPLFFPVSGDYCFSFGANALIEYNPDSTGFPDGGVNSSASSATWRTLYAASTTGVFQTDGYGVRIRCSGTTATSRYSRFE